MKGAKEIKISYWAAHLTTTVSVTLVVLLAGIIALISLSAQKETKRLRERLEVSLIMNDTVSNTYAQAVADKIAEMPFAIQPGVISKEQALKEWQTETGEDLEALFGVNPLSPEIFFRLKSEYSSQDSINNISDKLNLIPGVESVAMPDSDMVEAMNRNVGSLAIILGIVALIMIVISFVLINNTVHLAIYSKRFTIHTMQLVGATDGFIRRPFIINNMIAGLVAGLLAAAITAVSLAAAPHIGWNDVAEYIGWDIYGWVAAGMVLTGTLICGFASWIATSKYLNKAYDELFS